MIEKYDMGCSVMEILQIIEELEETIDGGLSLLGYSIMRKEELLSMVDEIRLKLPDEIKQAKWVKEERQRILSEAQAEGETIIHNAKERAIALVDEHEIAKAAKAQAEEIMVAAKATDNDMRIRAIKYADSLLEKVETSSALVLDEVREGRRQLKK